MADFYNQFFAQTPSLSQTADSVLGPPPAPAPEPPSLDDQISEQTKRAKLRQLQLLEGLPAAMASDSAAARATQGAQAGAASQNASAYRGLANTPMPDIKKPQYQPLPTPPKAEYREPWQALGSPLAALAMIAGAFTRNSGTSTLRTAAAAMNAQRQGDMQGYKDARENFMDNFDRTIKANQMEHQQYKDAWEDSKLTWDAKVARINALATANQNSAVAGAARGGKVDELGKLIAANGKSIEILESLKPGFGEKPEQQAWDAANKEAKRVATAEGRGSDEGHIAELRAEFYKKYEPVKVGAGGAQHVPTPAQQTFDAYKAKAREALGPNASETDVVMEAQRQEAKFKDNAREADERRKAQIKEEVERNKAYAQWSRPAQLVFEGFGVKDDIMKLPSKVSALDNQKLIAAKRTMESTNAAAQFFAQNPKAVGMAATLFNKYKGSMFASPRWDNYDPANPGQMNAELNSVGDKLVKDSIANTYIPDYGYLKQGDASLAAEGLKLLMAAALEDASASGARGGSLGLDRIMLQNIYNTSTDPTTLLKFLQRRAEDSQNLWRQYDERINFGDADRAPKSMYMEILNAEDFGKLIGRSMKLPPRSGGQGAAPPRVIKLDSEGNVVP